ncbi:hypothetical protein [Pseudomonas phage vB_PA6_GUMS]|uniref:Uncharacterized protein n=1 Tax=Pseudomonas phage vB_PA6_GUMS TaxID=2656518 RepID=A0A8T8BEY2_9CAUD|nr:hypothetical protein [Pseudomonas phage vB_PA6_GUMS]
MTKQVQIEVTNLDEAFVQHLLTGGHLFDVDDYEVADRILMEVDGEQMELGRANGRPARSGDDRSES